MPHLTLQTRIQDGNALLGPFSELMNRMKRKIHAVLSSLDRKWNGDVAVSLYKDFGVSAKLMESAYAALQGELSSLTELAKLHVEELEAKLAATAKKIAAKKKKLGKALKKRAVAVGDLVRLETRIEETHAALEKATASTRPQKLQQYKSLLGTIHREYRQLSDLTLFIGELQDELHQHKRKLRFTDSKIEKMRRRVLKPKICFGSKKLFKAQYHLKANGFSSHEEWLTAWRAARSSTFMIEGSKASPSGNRFARLTARDDGLFDVELRLPEVLGNLGEVKHVKAMGKEHVLRCACIKGLDFKHRSDELRSALKRKIPVSVRFHRDETSWRIMVSFDTASERAVYDYSRGAVGVDFNVGFASVTRTDRFGNVVETFDVPMATYGKSQGQSLAIVRDAAAVIAAYGKKHDLPIVSEKLDFALKKRTLKDATPAYARMLSSFAYSSFDAALASACARSVVYHGRVNPAYTSIVGRTKFASRHGLSVHAAAALAIARRAMRLGEKLPRSFEETRSVVVPLDDAHHVTLALPARKKAARLQADGARHVWSDWNEVSKAFRVARNARGPSRRRLPRPIMGRNDLHSMVCRGRPDVLGIPELVVGLTGRS